ncbi:MAG: TonB-dependent receptor, partial [Chitinophagaceae bacterium]
MLSYFKRVSFATALAIMANAASAQVTPPKTANDTIIDQIRGDMVTDNIPVISLDENDGLDGSSQNVSSQLSAGRDPFLNAATFKFSAVRFRIRGYDSDMFGTYMNGIPMENLDNGFTPYGIWGGLNDVMRNRDVSHGLRATPYAFGEFGGLTYLDTRASYQRQQTSVNYALSNRNYQHRFMASHSTGLNKKGWAFTVSGSRRWADEGYSEGTYYDGFSVFTAVDKRINDRHLLSFVGFVAPTENGRQGATFQEMLDIAGTNYYNPYWGYQNGKVRNASVGRSVQPVGILSHDWKITDKMNLFTSASFSKGYRSTTALDWYNAPDPRPDYYRYMPSYQLDPEMAELVRLEMLRDVNQRQINWDALYNVNYNSVETFQNANGIPGNSITGKRSHYIVEERRIDQTRYNFNTVLNTALKSNIDFTAGFTYSAQKNHYYKIVDDLLGGDFYADINQFAERDFRSNAVAIQNDLNRPNRILYEGDKFGYNYDINIKKAAAFAQANFKFRKIDFFTAIEHSHTRFWREGNVRNGLFPNNSFGKADYHDFYNYSGKAGVTYKVDGRNYLFVNGGYMTRAPFFENAFIAPRTRDIVQDLENEKITTVEGGYVMNAPSVKLRATAYYTQFRDQMNVLSFYHDEYRNFVNYAVSNIGKVHSGIELGAEAKVYKGLSLNAAASIGRYYYNTRQNAVVTVDNTSQVVAEGGIIYSNNFRVPTPQEAYTIGFDYRSPKFWFLNVNFNFFNNMWLDFNPLRRTEAAVNGVEKGSELWNDILGQEQLK